MQVAVYTLGCKVNQFESWAMEQAFQRLGCTIAHWKEEADLYLVNTCTVTSKAAYQSRQMIRRLRRQCPDAKIIATGCHVQTDASTIIESVGPGICLAGNEQKPHIAELAMQHQGCTGIYVSDIGQVNAISDLFLHRPPSERTRAYLRIQDGCNSFCSYCIVPYARGRSRSLKPEQVMKQMAIYSQAGIKEVVVTGIHVGLYGKDLPEKTDLFSLLQILCARFPDIFFRLSSIEPTEISSDFIEWAAETRNFCPHFHIPLQSGSDQVLEAMNRDYSGAFFRDLLHFIAETIPGCCIGTDVMTGFPTETDTDFANTVELIRHAPISYVHAFPYSARPGTVAAAMERACPAKEAKKRAAFIRQIGLEKKLAFFETCLGTKMDVLVERYEPKTGLYKGHTPNYVPVSLDSVADLKNQKVKVEITSISPEGVKGKLCQDAI